MKAFEVSDFAALVGIDWADRKHDICEVNCHTNIQCLSERLKSAIQRSTRCRGV